VPEGAEAKEGASCADAPHVSGHRWPRASLPSSLPPSPLLSFFCREHRHLARRALGPAPRSPAPPSPPSGPPSSSLARVACSRRPPQCPRPRQPPPRAPDGVVAEAAEREPPLAPRNAWRGAPSSALLLAACRRRPFPFSDSISRGSIPSPLRSISFAPCRSRPSPHCRAPALAAAPRRAPAPAAAVRYSPAPAAAASLPPRGAVLLRRHQPQLHPQHHPGKHARVDPLILSPLSLSLASWIRGAGERCLRADPAADLARALLVSAGTGEESR